MNFFNDTFFVSVLLCLLAVSLPLKADPSKHTPSTPNYLMAAMGDSMTAGFLASTDLDWFNAANLTLPQEAEDFITAFDAISGVDKASSYFDITGELAHLFETRTTKSWSTGLEIQSHYVRLSNALRVTEPTAKISSLNVALSGGETSDLYDQANTIVREMKTGKYSSLKYVTLLIGNNDACKNRDQTAMKTDLHNIFGMLSTIRQTEPIKILMSGIPRIPDLGEIPIDESKTIFKYSCQAFRQTITRMCLPLTGWSQQSQYLDLIQYVQGINETLSEAANDANSSFTNLDVHFSNALFDNALTKDNLAIDCFHPNTTSQSKIAQDLWNDQPWFANP